MLRRFFGKIIIRIRMFLERMFDSILMMLILVHMRNDAHRFRRMAVRKKGRRVVNRQVRKKIKSYCKQRFGSKSYWPSLALYTERKGTFQEGWIPSDYFRFKLMRVLNPEPAMHMDFKTFDYQIFGDFAIRPLFIYVSGMYLDPELNFVERELAVAQISEYDDEIVIKEEYGWGGLKVRILHASEFTQGLLRKGANYVIQPFVRQNEVMNKLYPHSVNTLRVNTFLQKDGSVSVKSILLRFGIDGSRVDNITSGGTGLYIDKDGKPDEFACDVDTGIPISDRHKNTGYRFADLKIPMFSKLLEKCKQAHKKVPYLRFVAWDACVDINGEPKLIEWNATNPEFASHEIRFGPFWPDDSEF